MEDPGENARRMRDKGGRHGNSRDKEKEIGGDGWRGALKWRELTSLQKMIQPVGKPPEVHD